MSVMERSSFTYDDLIDCGHGKLFGDGNAQLPLPPMLMFDRIINISKDGGEFGKGEVVAEFDIDARPGLGFLLNKQGIEFQKSLILRRVLSHDGPSRAFINDEPVSATFLREVGEMLVEVNGQMEAHGLLDPRNQGHFVDLFGCLEEEKKSVALNYRLWKEADNKL